MASEITTNQKGQFLPANIWRYRPGQSGHPPKYSYRSLRPKIIEYVDLTLNNGDKLLWSGLALYLGMSRQALDKYSKGEIGKDTSAIVDLIEYYRTALEMQRERQLTDKDYATNGVIFALKQHHGWRDEEKQSITQPQINIVLGSDSQLARDLGGNESITIEHAP